MKWENGSDPRKRNQNDAPQALWTLGTRVTGLFPPTIIVAQTSYPMVARAAPVNI
ncbi:hypothetical protein [uncultured Sphingomonas sp.]|uniref:hypothetical protein n=1 Tax=uncultured Sphingomonas sp. TaxID=158754 RepID=UPI0025FF9E10|nr:hypothetical protein [uncultured Sphingomonas sp.]